MSVEIDDSGCSHLIAFLAVSVEGVDLGGVALRAAVEAQLVDVAVRELRVGALRVRKLNLAVVPHRNRYHLRLYYFILKIKKKGVINLHSLSVTNLERIELQLTTNNQYQLHFRTFKFMLQSAYTTHCHIYMGALRSAWHNVLSIMFYVNKY